MKTNKKAIGSFLAVVMLLVVSIATASTYTVRPALNNNVDVGEQMVAEEAEQIIVSTTKGDDAYIYGTVRERYLEPWGDWWSRPFPGVTIMARCPGVHKEVITDEDGLFGMYLSPGTYLLSAYKGGYLVTFPPGHWRFGEWINSSYKRTWGAGDSAHYAFELLDKDEMEPEAEQVIVSITKPSSLGILGKATLNIHAEVADYTNEPSFISECYVRVVLLFTPFWFRFIFCPDGVTDSNGDCQLHVSALPEWLDIPLYYRVWVTDIESGQMAFGGTGGVYAGKTYNIDFLVIRYPPSPVNNVAEQKVLQSLQNR